MRMQVQISGDEDFQF